MFVFFSNFIKNISGFFNTFQIFWFKIDANHPFLFFSCCLKTFQFVFIQIDRNDMFVFFFKFYYNYFSLISSETKYILISENLLYETLFTVTYCHSDL